ncbi:MAG: polysulfide reductase NrfD [Draconibacterium sp.]|nr:polysulfide reductase NrfD [Draconibacterium sp.]
MKKILFLSLIFFYTLSLFAQTGKVLESLEFTSKLVSSPVKYSIYLPPGYDISERSYPVVYLLHGYSDDETGWVQFGEIDRIADRGIANGDISSSIIVMPDGKVTWYCNSYDGSDPWEDMFIDEFIPYIEKPNKQWWVTVAILVAIIGIGFVALVYQLMYGHIVTGMRDFVVWGVYIINFIFFLGLSYAGALIAGVFHLAGIQWGKPFHRILKIITVTTLIIGPVYILLCIGRPERIMNLFIYARIQSPITWDIIAITTDMFFCIAYLFFIHIEDFAKLRDYPNLKVANWRKKLYGWLAIGYKGTKEQRKLLRQALNIMAAIIIPTSIIAYSLLAWLFGMNLRPGWHNSIFAPSFVLTAIYSGVALLIVVIWVYRKANNLEKYFTDEHFNYLGFSLMILALFYGYFSFSEYITEWYNSQKTPSILLDKLWDFSDVGGLFLFSNIVAAILPVIIIGFAKFRSVNSITLTSALILVALWIKRYLIIVPTLETPYIPIQDSRMDWVHYSATWVEWALTLAGVAFFVLVFVLMSKFVPIVCVSEMEEKSHGIRFFYKTRK